jgi:glycosyltransferase involved in cell wall biosynthesis
VRVGLEAGRDADVVVTSCAPYQTALAGARLAAELGKPWVADLEDPWALDEMWLHPTALHRAVDLRRMRRALASSAAVIMAAPEAAERVRRTMPELAGRVSGIPIGFEPSDFAAPAPPRDDGVFRIVHTGSMHTDFGLQLRCTRRRRRLLGGAFPGVDFLTRSHVFLLDAVEALLAAEPRLAGRVELHLAGNLTPGDLAACDGRDFVRVAGLLTHRETVALMRSADLLFLPMQDLPQGTRAGLIPYKTYEYLAAARPILAAVPDGDVRDMLSPLAHCSLVRPADVGAMVEVLRARIAGGGADPADDAFRTAQVRGYERSACVARIAAVLDGVLGRSAAAPSLAA